jgi:glycosyltransferase involved in cell wall biosynthesis
LVLDQRFTKRKLLVRALNVEHLYYKGLAATTEWSLKKCYYLWEAYCLKKYEPKVAAKADIIAISAFDNDYFSTQYKARNSSYIPVFFESIFNIPIGSGDYCIYHGNLSVAENEEAVYWLIEKVFKLLSIPLVIAGKNPSEKLIVSVNNYNHIHIVANPDKEEMDSLIADAHINVLPAINSTGVKLKIVTALYQSRFCITNTMGAMGMEDKDLLIVEDEASKMKAQIIALMQMEFTPQLKEQRIKALQNRFSLADNAQKLIALIGFK